MEAAETAGAGGVAPTGTAVGDDDVAAGTRPGTEAAGGAGVAGAEGGVLDEKGVEEGTQEGGLDSRGGSALYAGDGAAGPDIGGDEGEGVARGFDLSGGDGVAVCGEAGEADVGVGHLDAEHGVESESGLREGPAQESVGIADVVATGEHGPHIGSLPCPPGKKAGKRGAQEGLHDARETPGIDGEDET